MREREHTVVETGESGGWTVAIILLVVALAGGLVLFEVGYLGNRDVNINVSLPKVDTPAPVTQ